MRITITLKRIKITISSTKKPLLLTPRAAMPVKGKRIIG